MSQSGKSHWLEIVRTIFDFAIIVVMALGLNASFKANETACEANETAREAIETSRVANKLTRKSLRISYVPWLSVISVKLLEIDPNNFKIAIRCKNFSNAPALKLDIKYNILGETVTGRIKSYYSDALMPDDERGLEVTATVRDGRAGKIVEKLRSGECAIEFEINYEDIFGGKLAVHYAGKYKDSIFRTTKYEIYGIEVLFKEIE